MNAIKPTGLIPLCFVLLACATTSADGAAVASVLDARFPEGRQHQGLSALAAEVDLSSGDNIIVRELSRDADSSHHLVAVKDREPPHRHDKSALWVVLLRGTGKMMIEGEERPISAGSVVYVPRATVHAYINNGPEPGVAYVAFSPPFDPNDRVAPDAQRPALPGTALAE